MSTIRSSFQRALLLAALLLAGAALGRAQSVTLQFSAGRLYDSSGSLLGDGGLVLLLADTQQNGFGTLAAGNIDIGDYLSGGLQVLGRTTVNAMNGTASAAGTTNSIPLGAGSFPQLSTGDRLAIAWFPTLGASSFSFVSGTSYGLFSDATWLVPSAGAIVTFEFFTIARGGSYNDALGQATLSAIPEPSTSVAIMGAAALGLAAWRRQRQRTKT